MSRNARCALLGWALIISGSSVTPLVFRAASSVSAQSRGNLLDQRLQKSEDNFKNAEGRQSRLASGSVDRQITDHLITKAWFSLRNSKNMLDALEYTRAEQLLNSAALEIDNVNLITSEDENIPKNTLLDENKEDSYLESVEQAIPSDLSNRKKRALIWSEQALVQKMFAKALAHHCPLVVIPSDPTVRQIWEFSGRYTVENTQYSAYLTAATEMLYGLNYDESHRMMYEAYRAAQKILAGCNVLS